MFTMLKWKRVASLVVELLLVSATCAMQCNRKPVEIGSPRSPGSGHFLIDVAGNPHSYSPGKKYAVTLRSSDYNDQNKFISFLLVVENDEANAGTFQLLGDALTMFDDRCPNAVTQTNSIAKTEIQVWWVAPPPNSGCVVFKAVVVVSLEIWYQEDGSLSRTLCESAENDEGAELPILQTCCACHEAKYEVTFESLWSRNTHPKDFPPNNFITKFSDIIGATHSVDYQFWKYRDYASDGLKELAEKGNTKLLERELKDKSNEIRTIIKARGISYPNITGKTFAVFRVDERHHLMSLVSMIHPSPDWIVGVSSLELCQSNCSWVESKSLNLFPWDVGTDGGTTYLSEDDPLEPRQPIERITTKHPPDSPFFDDSGSDMKPLARLILSRQRLYEKHNCEGPNKDDKSLPKGYCDLTEWSDWSNCSLPCGKGWQHRQRTYKNRDSDNHRQKHKCKGEVTARRNCFLQECVKQESTAVTEGCALTPWGRWSECSVSCGSGTMTRSRKFVSRRAHKDCLPMLEDPPRLEENKPCQMPDCDGSESMPPECEERAWSEWSPCSVTCGEGTKTRKKTRINVRDLKKHSRNSRSFDYDREYFSYEEDDPCENVTETADCLNDQMPVCDESTIISESHPEDCIVSEWSDWSDCNVSCGRGVRSRYRQIIQASSNGGKPCPKKRKLTENKKCSKGKCHIDCVLSEWSPWSPCNRTCGPHAERQKTRNIIRQRSGKGKPCGERILTEPCHLSVCPDF